MQYSNHTFIHSSNNISLTFIIISFIMILLFIICSLVIKFKKINNKIVNSKNLVFLSSILGLIMGIIFGSMISFQDASILNIKNHMWLWDCISFVFSFGSLFVSLMFLTCWLIIPLIAYKTIKKFIFEIDMNDKWKEMRKLGFIILFMTITIGFSNLGWIIPLNDVNTPLTIFNENNHIFLHDDWYLTNKFMYDHCYLTKWYPWVFLGYLLFVFVIVLIIIKVKYHDQITLEKWEKRFSKFGALFHIFDSFSAVSSYCFISSYFLFNWEFLFIHIGYSLLVLFLTYLCICIILLSWYFIKYHHKDKKLTKPLYLFKMSFVNHFSFNETKKVSLKSFNLTDFSVVALSFTLYMGFSTNFDFNQAHGHEIIFNDKMDTFPFWFQVIFSCLLLNIISDNNAYNSSVSKLLVAEATYSVTPGLQTGILTWFNPLFKPISDFINHLSYIFIEKKE